jgi:hypothetical protein
LRTLRKKKADVPTIEGSLGLALVFVQWGLDALGWTLGSLQAPAAWAVATFLIVHGFWRADVSKDWNWRVKSAVACLIFAVFAATSWVAYQDRESLLARETMPGFESNFAVSFRVAQTNRPQYLYDFKTSDGAEVAFFLAENASHFALQITDIHGETHSLITPVRESGVPIGRVIFLVTQVGVSDTATYLQIVINGEDVAHETINYPLDLGAKDWVKHGTFFVDKDHKDYSAHQVLFIGATHTTWTKDHYTSHEKNVRQLLNAMGAQGVKQ